jgi:23S rRNA (pseudouridine1915-N3)-methyltransferase
MGDVMLNIFIIAVGRLKEEYLRAACGEYIKRLGAFCKIQIVEIEEERLSENPSDAQIHAGLEAEGNKIISKLPSSAEIISLCIEGNKISSLGLAQKLQNIGVMGKSNVVFIIGGSFGLSEKVKSLSNLRLSMSDMTFPHQLTRVMLLEQIYRAMSISNGGKYHK